jgi:hypothetical protein
MMSRADGWFTVIVFTWLIAIGFISNKAFANYSFPIRDVITMEVVKQNRTGGGTYLCPSVRACYISVLKAEARGAAQYCESLQIKRNGHVVWERNYQN